MDGFWIAFGNTVNRQIAGCGGASTRAAHRSGPSQNRAVALPGLGLADAPVAHAAPLETFRLRVPETGLYRAQKGKAGSARSFVNPGRNPNVVSLREPHLGGNLGQAMLRKYLRKLILDPNEFKHLLEDC